MSESLYEIIRFYQDDRPDEIQRAGMTLEKAQEYCQRPDTKGDGWFDGYQKMKTTVVTLERHRTVFDGAHRRPNHRES